MAMRLSENPNHTVLLLEAGPNFDPNKFPKDLLDASIIGTDKYDWGYKTTKGYLGYGIDMLRAKVYGGCSSHNATAAIRATSEDFTNWNVPNWSFNDVLPYYKKLENILPIRYTNKVNDICRAFINSAINNGFEYINDFNNNDQHEGIGISSRTAINNIRQNTAITYLSNKIRKRKNLFLLGNCEINKIVFERNKPSAILAINGNVYYFKKEIILCSGVFGSAAILLRSGIGPEKLLNNLDIPIISNLLVGETLYDHPIYYDRYKLKLNSIENKNKSENKENESDNKENESEIGTLLWTKLNSKILNVQIIAFTDIDNGSHILTLGIALTQPESVGNFLIKSKNPQSIPIISPNYLANVNDRRNLIDAIKLSRKITETEPLKSIIEFKVNFKTDMDLENHILRNIESYGHPSSTIPLNKVLDSNCCVKGIENLRVVDASIFPKPLSTPLNLTVIMAAEKIADQINNDF